MREKKYTCWHCNTGIVNRLPANCPECDKYLNKEVEKREKRRHRPNPMGIVTVLLTACGAEPARDTATDVIDVIKTTETCIEADYAALYTLHAHSAREYSDITAAIAPPAESTTVYVSLERIEDTMYYTADVRFANSTCHSELNFTYQADT